MEVFMKRQVASKKTVWGLRRGRKSAVADLIGRWWGFMWYPHYFEREGKNFAPKKGEWLRVWKQEQGKKWGVFEGIIRKVETFRYKSRDEVEPFFGDDPTYVRGKKAPRSRSLHCDSV